ncbi:unnamed protein product, partial [Ectocarpus sp. 8 AP-2014]
STSTATTPAASTERDGGGGGGRRGAGKALRECLSGMARGFFQGANKEGVAVLKQMLEMEAWQRVPVPLKADEGGVGGLIDTNAQRFCSPHRVYRGIRKPYLHLMHDVMALEEEQESSPEQSPERSSSCSSSSATKPTLDPSSTPPTTPPPPSPPPPPD